MCVCVFIQGLSKLSNGVLAKGVCLSKVIHIQFWLPVPVKVYVYPFYSILVCNFGWRCVCVCVLPNFIQFAILADGVCVCFIQFTPILSLSNFHNCHISSGQTCVLSPDQGATTHSFFCNVVVCITVKVTRCVCHCPRHPHVINVVIKSKNHDARDFRLYF